MPLPFGWHVPPRRVVLWHTVAAVPLTTVIVLGAYLSYHYHELSMRDRATVDRGYEVLYRADALFVSVEDADVSERDFLITGNSGDLASYASAVRSVGPDEQQLMRLLADSPEQKRQLGALGVAIAAKLDELGRTIALRQTNGFDAARAVVERGAQRASMDQVRVRAATLVATERGLLGQRQEVGRRRERDVLLIGVLIAALSIATRIAIACTLAIMRRRGKRRESTIP